MSTYRFIYGLLQAIFEFLAARFNISTLVSQCEWTTEAG